MFSGEYYTAVRLTTSVYDEPSSEQKLTIHRHGWLFSNTKCDRRSFSCCVLLLNIYVWFLERSWRCRASTYTRFRKYQRCYAEKDQYRWLYSTPVREIQKRTNDWNIRERKAFAYSVRFRSHQGRFNQRLLYVQQSGTECFWTGMYNVHYRSKIYVLIYFSTYFSTRLYEINRFNLILIADWSIGYKSL